MSDVHKTCQNARMCVVKVGGCLCLSLIVNCQLSEGSQLLTIQLTCSGHNCLLLQIPHILQGLLRLGADKRVQCTVNSAYVDICRSIWYGWNYLFQCWDETETQLK